MPELLAGFFVIIVLGSWVEGLLPAMILSLPMTAILCRSKLITHSLPERFLGMLRLAPP
jgi:hypothetical protein